MTNPVEKEITDALDLLIKGRSVGGKEVPDASIASACAKVLESSKDERVPLSLRRSLEPMQPIAVDTLRELASSSPVANARVNAAATLMRWVRANAVFHWPPTDADFLKQLQRAINLCQHQSPKTSSSPSPTAAAPAVSNGTSHSLLKANLPRPNSTNAAPACGATPN